ncbi:hypothetical protein QM331_32390, partial [Pseudomonas aeruginosa]
GAIILASVGTTLSVKSRGAAPALPAKD